MNKIILLLLSALCYINASHSMHFYIKHRLPKPQIDLNIDSFREKIKQLEEPDSFITLQCNDANVRIPKTIAYKSKLLKDLISDFDSIEPIDLTQLIGNCFDNNTIKKLAFCLSNEKNISSMPIEHLPELLKAADALGVKRNVCKQLTNRVVTELPETSYSSILIPILNLYQNSIRNTLKDLKKSLDHKYYNINLSGKQLMSLEGIDILIPKHRCQDVIHIDISQNNLQHLNLRRLLSIFPNLKSICASNNNIKILTKSNLKALPSFFTLNLSGNKLNRIDNCVSFCAPEGVKIKISDQLEVGQVNKLRTFLTPSWWQSNRLYVYEIRVLTPPILMVVSGIMMMTKTTDLTSSYLLALGSLLWSLYQYKYLVDHDLPHDFVSSQLSAIPDGISPDNDNVSGKI